MKMALFVHSLVSDWNHGNVHFLRGIVRELQGRGHSVAVFEPSGGWSMTNLLRMEGDAPVDEFRRAFPDLSSEPYELDSLDVGEVLEETDVCLVHEWNEPALVAAVGEARRRKPRLRVLFHDTHHRTATAPEQMDAFDLSGYDGVLAFGEAVARRYRARGHRVWVWHEAADTTVFRPLERAREGDLVWIGNWGDDERTQELQTYLLDPARTLGLRGSVYGVRYPEEGRRAVAASGLRYRGRIPNHRVPEAFARHAAAVHVPRRAYVRSLPGVPTIRVFEALACAIPLVCSPWEDSESLFTPGEDFLVARDCEEMTLHLKRVTSDEGYARSLAARGRRTIEARHTCAHRVDELMAIVGEIT